MGTVIYRSRQASPVARRERGVVLFVALIVLVVMALAGLAMMRGSGTGISISGNLAFKQNATNVADVGTEVARTWILTQLPGALDADNAASGYFSSWGGASDVDPMSLNWTANGMQATADDGTGNQVLYIVQRLCELPNLAANAPNQHCAGPSAGTSGTGDRPGQSRGGIGYPGMGPSGGPPPPYYRISSRVKGPRNTYSFIQVVIQ